ncbi:MAG TPA: c-type cytochrome [Candidatus Acidoferrales bacterium]|jgi:mono/diheme cytochrome c family protein|nr:c-type cytochrome [Candidatus Acidoferrales bacterium]
MRSKILTALAAIATSSGLLYGTVSAQSNAPSGDPKHGYTVFVVEGCYECHGYQGQGNGHRVPGGGGDVGPIIAPKPVPYAAFIKQLRGPRLVMPPYSTNILSDKDAADIYAYLASIPDAKDPKTLPLLNSVTTIPSGK